jgi:hypothetical protein
MPPQMAPSDARPMLQVLELSTVGGSGVCLVIQAVSVSRKLDL